MTYDDLLVEADGSNLMVKEKPLDGNDGRIYNNCIAIRRDIPTLKEKSCVLAEEMGHYYMNDGNITDQNETANRKQEYKARLWGYNKKVGLTGLVEAFNHGCQTYEDVAEYLDVTVDYLVEVLYCYHGKYGVCATLDNYAVFFEPSFAIVRTGGI